jgi:hypothetical protein
MKHLLYILLLITTTFLYFISFINFFYELESIKNCLILFIYPFEEILLLVDFFLTDNIS